MKILLDVDGPLTDFVGGACAAHGVENPYLQNPLGDAAGQYELATLLGLSCEEFAAPLQEARFWRRLAFTRDADAILQLAEMAAGANNVCLLTTPQPAPESVTGKVQWIKDRLPAYSSQFLVGPCKHFCAHADSVLIDDNDKNVETFIEHGGGAILVPRAWNMNWPERHRAADYVQWCLQEILDEQE